MLESISPYALLQASKPRPPKRITTDYDRFSLADKAAPSASPTPTTLSPAHPAQPMEADPLQAFAPARRTHYIADIHARHSSAIRHAPQNLPPL